MSNNVIVKISQEQLAALKALGLGFEEVEEPKPVTIGYQLVEPTAPEGYVVDMFEEAPLWMMVMEYIRQGQPLSKLKGYSGVDEVTHHFEYRGGSEYEIHETKEVPNLQYSPHGFYNRNKTNTINTVLWVRTGILYLNVSQSGKFETRPETIIGLNDLRGTEGYCFHGTLYYIRRWYLSQLNHQPIKYRLVSELEAERYSILSKLEEEKKVRYKAEMEKLDALETAEVQKKLRLKMEEERNKAVNLMTKMVSKNCYSGWHALYSFNYVADMVEWYIKSRNNKNHSSAEPRVKLKEFSDALDDAAFYLSRGNIIDPELKVKYRELHTRCKELLKQLDDITINIKYVDGNPRHNLQRIITVIEASVKY